jgi:phage tail-like protein
MSTSRLNPPAAYQFSVSFAEPVKLSGTTSDTFSSLSSAASRATAMSASNVAPFSDTFFQEVSGISAELSYDELKPLGSNDEIYYIPKSVSFSNLVLKRGLAPLTSEILNWCLRNVNSLETSVEVKNVVVTLMGSDFIPIMTWTFYNAIPVKWAVSDFNATKSELAIETIELKYSKMSYGL